MGMLDRSPGATERLLRRRLYRSLARPRHHAGKVDDEDGGDATPSASANPPGSRCSSANEFCGEASAATGGIFNLAYNPDGSMLAAACERKKILLFDPGNRRS